MIATDPPAPAALPPLDRRSLLKGGLFGAGLAAAPLSAQAGGRGFTHGVASGEPGVDKVMLWTRHVADQDVALEYQVAETIDFADPVAEGSAIAKAGSDWCAKSWADGLRAGTFYYYRFIAPDGTTSDIGRTKTLPEGPTERFRMAVFSCSNIGFGWFNAYAHAAEANEFDCALHLGDYVYEYGPDTYPAREQAARQALFPSHELVALADYRARFAQYRSDADLRRLHQLYPVIAVWDDHETANDSWEGGAENHQPDREGEWSARKAAAMQAYREWMPVSDEPWARYDIGDLATLYRLETRLTARAKQFSLGEILRTGGGTPEEAQAAMAAFRDDDYRDPARELLGAAQQGWLAEGLKASTGAGTVWQVLVQQVLMGNLVSSPTLAEALPKDTPGYIRQRVLAGAMAGAEGVPFNMDAWDGYPAARARLFEAALAADANLVSLAGDTHNAWAFDLDLDGTAVGVEFGGQSVTSPGMEGYLPQIPPEAFARDTVANNRQLQWMDSSRRGYMAVELTPGSATSEYRFLSSGREKGAGVVATKRVTTLAGSRKLSAG
ncbi:alkaline phosphatase D family protein [Qipengyuania sp. 6B39]|uniref:alkaline phosphatase D family protein n=1 Tax=Qipengyuania proteolytica TaxID=2867239 RepID=UPI001C8AFF33|nr:alkaline phosphatase D family protein [Qipengyuania proteolytica]MBX7494754.1 alkaline phosphatase D family protein [Qipengyuania proteolytica]